MSRRVLQIAKGVASLAALVVLLGGIPWALCHFVGWPLPHHVPTAGQVGRALDRQGIPAQALIDALAVVVWLAWASLLASVVAEIPGALIGRQARRLPVAGIFQPTAGRLVAAVLVAGLALAPRPAQPGGPAPLATRLPATAGRPVAALVFADTTGAHAPSILASPTTQPDAVAVSAPPPSSGDASSGTPATYLVQRGDTLWGIAERELGDPLRWSEIYALNEGRPQPGGATLTDPHWIDPGWTLLLPPSAAPSMPPPSPVPSATPSGTAPPEAPPTTQPPPTTPAPPVPSADNGHVPAAGARQHNTAAGRQAPVGLPSGSVVAGSFAAGVLSAVALGRLRRRHAYRYRPPEPGRDLTPPPLRPTLDHLVRVAEEKREVAGVDDEPDTGQPVSVLVSDHRLDPGQVDIGDRDGETLSAEVIDLSGTALSGPAVDDVARALLTGLLVRAGPGAAEVLLTDALAGRLLPGAPSNRAIRTVPTPDGVARLVEAERIARARRLDAVGATDAGHFRRDNPEHPLPVLLVLADLPEAHSAGRLGALAADGARLGISLVYLGETPSASGRLVADGQRRVIEAEPAGLLARFYGSELFGLGTAEAVELLDALAESLAPEPEPAERSADDADGGAEAAHGPGQRAEDEGADRRPEGEAWPEIPVDETIGDRPIRVELFGHLSVSVAGEPVALGLRSRAKQLLAWYLLRPEGATSEEAVDALWSDTAPDGVLRQFWRAFGDLRTRLREAGGDSLDVLVKTGEHYRPATEEIACDLWELQGALGDASRADGDDVARTALRRAVDAYRGELLQGCDWRWVEPIRADLHRRALDAHLRLAELEEAAGCSERAAEVLERAIELDGYAEEPYRRLMTLHGTQGRTDAVRATWKLLNRRMNELDLEVEPATARLYRALTAELADHPRPLPLSS